jgi:hypothetical protein
MFAGWGTCCGTTRRIFAGEAMTQLGEMVAIGTVIDKDIECPFHEKKHTCDESVINDLTGDAKTLGEKLESKSISDSSVLRTENSVEPYKSRFSTEPDPDKTYDFETERHVKIHEDIDCEYPVAFAAHHIIPAGASLNIADSLLPYIDSEKGKICCNLGYDVNGNENGVWLPGLHAVNKNGIDVWSETSQVLPDNESWKVLALASKKEDYLPLQGPRPGPDPDKAYEALNLKLLYVKAAMNFSKTGARQFHDAHPTYSGLVKDSLNQVGKVLDHLSTGNAKEKIEPSCPTCKKNKESNQNKLLPPLGLFGFLNKNSQHVKNNYIVGKIQHKEFFTSTWCDPSSPTERRERKSSK